jgi:hypothetical protein
MGMPGGQPAGPSPFLAGIGKGRFLGTRAAVLQRFDGSAWRDVASYRTTREADAALDRAVGDGEEPGALRVVDPAPSAGARALMIIGTAVCVAFAIGIAWIFVAGN